MTSDCWFSSSFIANPGFVVIKAFSLSRSLPFCAFPANFNIKILEYLPLFWLHSLVCYSAEGTEFFLGLHVTHMRHTR